MLRPAFTVNSTIPQSSDRRALSVREDSAETQEEVDCNQKEPHGPSLPALGKSQKSYGKRALAPGGSNDRAHAGDVGNIKVRWPVCDVPAMLAEAMVDIDRQQASLRNEHALCQTVNTTLFLGARHRSKKTHCCQN